jgi:hypothetical protein
MICGNSSVDRALAFQAKGRGFESRFPLFFIRFGTWNIIRYHIVFCIFAGVAQG